MFHCVLDASKAFDKLLHNGLFKKLLDRQVPLSFVLLLNNCNLHCAVRRVRWNKTIGEWFPILCGVRDGGVLSPIFLQFTSMTR